MLKLSTARNILIFMADATDNITGVTGLTLTITSSKAGAAFASISPTVTERTLGFYQIALTGAMADTLGDLVLYITGTGAIPTIEECHVVTDLPGDTVASVTGSVGSVTGLTVATIWAHVIETGFTATQSMRLMLSALAAKLSGAATTTVTIRDINDTKARITATVDADGNRSAVTTDVT